MRTYKIGAFARFTQTSVKTLRYYDALGLLRPAHVDRSTGYRFYTAAQVERLNKILVLKDLGLSLLEIRALLADAIAPATLRAMRGEQVAPSEYYMRSAPFFETGDPRYAWLNTIVAIGVGERLPDGAIYDVHEVL